MFSKILIANRGEIACRVIKTARRMGISTVAVYSDADRDALHVEMADEAVHIGPAPSADSYLVIERIVAACRATGAQAVHPGYGFLSEREAFADALAAAGIVFIGPNTHAIAAMGDKIESKKLAAKAGVNTVPGYAGEIRDTAHAGEIAGEIGYPVMVKASAGGGGKGLRIVHTQAELAQAIRSAMNEARSSFGDDRIFVEKFVTEPRHIEIQVLGDKHGNVIHLGERECSIQRRHQKVIEEAPSPFIDAKTRAEMGAQAVALAKAVGYDSAGTVEFIVDGQRNFYFLEMNTRLQVEHPVTELVTGIDLVEQMIRVAAGETLTLRQEAVKLDGWALESRIYAEDPYRNFLPSIGRLVRYRPPAEGEADGARVRNDTGVYEGGEISMFYDPMIAKLCTHAATRDQAIARMGRALDEFLIEGIQHNIAFLGAIMAHPRFREGRLTTGFIAEEYPDGFHGAPMGAGDQDRFMAAAAFVHGRIAEQEKALSGRLFPPGPTRRDWIVTGADGARAAAVDLENGTALVAFEDGPTVRVTSDWRPFAPLLHASIDGTPFAFQLRRSAAGLDITQGGRTVRYTVRSPQAAALAALMPEKAEADTSKLLLCPMPGLVVSINVHEGQEVKAGEALAVVEAMKMENVLRAERDATVSKIHAAKGDSLAVDAMIMEFA